MPNHVCCLHRKTAEEASLVFRPRGEEQYLTERVSDRLQLDMYWTTVLRPERVLGLKRCTFKWLPLL